MSNYGQSQGQGGRYGQFNPYAQQNDTYQPQSGYGQPGGYEQQPDHGAQPQQGGYGRQQDPYAQQQPYGQQTGVAGRPAAQTFPSSNYGEEQGNNAYEMGSVNGTTAGRNDPNAILNDCREVSDGIDQVQQSIRSLQSIYSDLERQTSPDEEQRHLQKVNAASETTTRLYRNLVERMKRIKSDPASGNPRNEKQVGATDRRLKSAINQYQQAEAEFRRRLQDQKRRQYLTIHPDAGEVEVTQAVEDTMGVNMFQTALLQGNRRSEANSALNNVRDRNREIQNIEKTLIELAQMFQDLDATVIQQEAAVTNIEQQGEQVEENVARANVEIDGAIVSAKAARRKKFWCLGIAILIVIIIVVVVVVVVLVLRSQNKAPAAAAPAASPTTAAKIKLLRAREVEPVPF